MQIPRRRECQVCGGNNIRHLFDNAMAPLAGVDLSYQVGDCVNCGFSFAYELPNDVTYQSYYQTLSKYDVLATLSDSDQVRFDAIVRLLQSQLPPQSIVVDIGCGEGALLSKLRTAGYQNLFGIDPAPNVRAIALKKYGLDSIRQGFFDDAATVVPLTSADGICIAAVLEHLPNLRVDMQQLLRHLKPKCKLFIEVPTLELFGHAHGEPYGEFSLEHVNYFCSATLSNLMITLGWYCEQSEYLAFPELQTGSVISVFGHSKSSLAVQSPNTVPKLDTYVNDCNKQVNAMLEKIPNSEIIIYGAGSHSARILPLLAGIPTLTINAIVDNNPNLTGKTLGTWEIQTPSLINTMPGVPILVSSFRLQNEIANALRNKYPNPLVLLYP